MTPRSRSSRVVPALGAFREVHELPRPLVDDGRFVITYQSQSRQAILATPEGRVRMPIEALGSGIQQIASLLARVLLGNSAIVAVEEPELNLRYDLQLRLRDILKDITESGTRPPNRSS
jgi:hypothetical protein